MAPHLVEQIEARDDRTASAHERDEEVELQGCESDGAATPEDGPRGQIDLDVAEALADAGLLAFGPRGPAEQRRNPREQFENAERPGDVVVCAKPEARTLSASWPWAVRISTGMSRLSSQGLQNAIAVEG
jgi:hypothetical protein